LSKPMPSSEFEIDEGGKEAETLIDAVIDDP
jgi:hypothetical protein